MWNEFSEYPTSAGSASAVGYPPFLPAADTTSTNQIFSIPTSSLRTEASVTNGNMVLDAGNPPQPTPLNYDLNTQPHTLPAVAERTSNSENRRTSNGRTKRKFKDVDRRIGKSLVDTYSKRSAGLVKKGEELCDLTGAYVVIFSARPESIGEGLRRLYLSDGLKNAESDLCARIDQVTKELEAIALELARRSGYNVHRRKGSHVTPSSGPSDNRGQANSSLEHDISSSQAASTNSSSHGHATIRPPVSTMTQEQNSTPHSHGNSVRNTATTAIMMDETPLSMTQGEIATVCDLLKTSHKKYALDVLQRLVQSDSGVRAVCEAQAIPKLVNLLDQDPISVACPSALILSKMAHHFGSHIAMLRAGMLPPFIQLLSKGIDDEVLTAVGGTLALPIPTHDPDCRPFVRALDSDTLQLLVRLLAPGRMSVRLAAAAAIKGITSAEPSDIVEDLREGNTVRSLCHLVLDCRNLSEQESVVSAISALRTKKPFEDEVTGIINLQILPPLKRLLKDSRKEMVIGACRILRRPMIKENGEASVKDIIPLLSCPDDEIFAEAAWIAAMLTWHNIDDDDLPDSFNLAVIRRLIRLLHDDREQVVVSAIRSIGHIRCKALFLDIFLEMAESNSIRHFISLPSSNNIQIAAAALDAVKEVLMYACATESFAIFRKFVDHGAVRTLVHNFTRHSQLLLHRSLDVAREFPSYNLSEEISKADVEPHLVRLLSSNDVWTGAVIDVISDINIWHDMSIFQEAGICQALLQLAQRAMNSSEPHLDDIMDLIDDIVGPHDVCDENRRRMRADLREAGMGPVIEKYLLREGVPSFMRDRLRRCLDRLCQDEESESSEFDSD